MNMEQRTKSKNYSEEDLIKLMNNSVFEKTMENVQEHRGIRLVSNKGTRCHPELEPNYHTAKWFSENLQAIELKKTELKMNKLVCLGLSIRDISKIAIY